MTTSIEQMTEQAQHCLDNNQIEQARNLYQEICKQNDSIAEAWMMLGAINGQTGGIAEAITCLRRAVDIDSNLAEAHFILAQVLRAQNDIQGAIDAANAAVASDPQYDAAYLFLSGLHGQSGNKNLCKSSICI